MGASQGARLPQLRGETPSPYLHNLVERTRASGGGLQHTSPDLLPNARAVPKINMYKRRDKISLPPILAVSFFKKGHLWTICFLDDMHFKIFDNIDG